MNRSKIFIILAVVGLLLATSLIWYFVFQARHDRGYLVLYGNVDVRQVDLGFKVTGRVECMVYDEGDLVKQGALMAVLEKQPYEDQVREAKASLESAKTSFSLAEDLLTRRQKLVERGGVSQEDLQNAQSTRDVDFSNLTRSQASLGVAETNLRDTEMFSPTDGIILTRVREPGTVVNVGDPIYTLSVLSPVWIRAYVAEPHLGNIYFGMPAKIFTDTEGLHVYDGHIGFISPVAEFTPKTVETTELRTDLVYRIRVIADNPDCLLKQGMPVTVKLRLAERESSK